MAQTKLAIEIHEKAKQCAENLRKCEIEMIEALQRVAQFKVYRQYGAKSLFQYAVAILGLSETRAYDYICVARKIESVDALKVALVKKKITVSKARRLSSVITNENADHWIGVASMSSQRNLEREISRISPDSAHVHEGSRWVSNSRLEFKANIDEKTDALIRRVQDLESQKQKRAVSFGEALKTLASDYLKRHDPVEKASRSLAKSLKDSARAEFVSEWPANAGTRRSKIPKITQNEVIQRDQGRCQALDLDGRRCGSSRWVDLHHVTPVSQGGQHRVSNLVTLCRSHHQMIHDH